MNITVDTNFLISATQWDNSVAFKLLKRLLEANIKIFTTKDILDEFSEVLQRDFKYNKEEKRWDSEHHPFTSMKKEDLHYLETGEYDKIYARS